MRRYIALLALAPAAACSSMGFDGALGVTQGGSQDISLAREIIELGGIPDQEHFTSEGLFSEHDLPLDGEDCEAALCPRAAAALVDPVDGGGERYLAQVGFGTMFQSDTFERRPLNLSIAVDISGSMSGEKLETVRDAMTEMVERLTAEDTVSLIAFDDQSEIRLRPRSMDASGRGALADAIAGLEVDGGTNIEAGLSDAYSLVAPTANTPGVEDRVMLLTDAQPNVAGTSLNTFMGMASYYSAAGVGLSVFGVGLDLGSELASRLSELPGGNSFFLADAEDIRRIFNEEFDYLVTPLGYDLDVEIAPTGDLRVDETWATPTDPIDDSVTFGASTLFLSARGGGMGLALTHPEALPGEGELARFDLSYDTAEGDPTEDTLSVSFDGGVAYDDGLVRADGLGVYKMAYLIDELIALKAAADHCDGAIALPEARQIIDEAAERMAGVAETLGDEAMRAEVALLDQLSLNMGGPDLDCWVADQYVY